MKSANVKWPLIWLLAALALLGTAAAQRTPDTDPTAVMNFLIVKEDNGKPVRNAAVIMHPVNTHGQQSRGGLELKTDADGKTSFDGIPYGKLRVQVLAPGFQTFGEDYDVDKAKLDLTIKRMRRKTTRRRLRIPVPSRNERYGLRASGFGLRASLVSKTRG